MAINLRSDRRFGACFGVMAIYLKHQNAKLALIDLKLPVLIAKFEGTWSHSESYYSVIERPGAIDSTCICSLGCLLHAQIKS